jgi:hypothetical protein
MLEVDAVNQTAFAARHFVAEFDRLNPLPILRSVIFHYITNSFRKMADPAA